MDRRKAPDGSGEGGGAHAGLPGWPFEDDCRRLSEVPVVATLGEGQFRQKRGYSGRRGFVLNKIPESKAELLVKEVSGGTNLCNVTNSAYSAAES